MHCKGLVVVWRAWLLSPYRVQPYNFRGFEAWLLLLSPYTAPYPDSLTKSLALSRAILRRASREYDGPKLFLCVSVLVLWTADLKMPLKKSSSRHLLPLEGLKKKTIRHHVVVFRVTLSHPSLWHDGLEPRQMESYSDNTHSPGRSEIQSAFNNRDVGSAEGIKCGDSLDRVSAT